MISRFRTTLAWLAGIGLAGCATVPLATVPDVPQTPQSLAYTYLMAHGMAFGYAMATEPALDRLDALIALDHNAQTRVLLELHQPSPANLQSANQALLALLAAVSPKDTALPIDQRPAGSR